MRVMYETGLNLAQCLFKESIEAGKELEAKNSEKRETKSRRKKNIQEWQM